jgi:hypothetical protein
MKTQDYATREAELRNITESICVLFPPARLLEPGGYEQWEGCRIRVSGVPAERRVHFQEVMSAALSRAGYRFSQINLQPCLDRYLVTMDIVALPAELDDEKGRGR